MILNFDDELGKDILNSASLDSFLAAVFKIKKECRCFAPKYHFLKS